MPDLFFFEDTEAQSAKIKVIGVGGGGGKALNNMISQNIRAVEFIMVDTDAQSIKQSLAETT
ncbi:MAG: cell division protein FtsZ, partial [Mariprofundus sp.]